MSVVDTVDEAIELANATNYTLGATIWTRDLNTALSVSSRVCAGTYNIILHILCECD